MDTNAECSVSKTLQQIQKALAQKKICWPKCNLWAAKAKRTVLQNTILKLGTVIIKNKTRKVWIWIFERHFKFNLIIGG